MRLYPALFCVLSCTFACGAVQLGGAPREAAVPEEARAELGARFREAQTRMLDAEDERLAQAEADTIKALRVALGKEPLEVAAGPTSSAGTQLRAVRKAHIPTRAVVDKDDLVMIEIPPGVHDAAFLDLRQKVADLSFVTMSTNLHLVAQTFDEIVRISGLVQTYGRYGVELGDEDYALIRRSRSQVKKLEALAGVTMGLLASYEAVLSSNADPKALDTVAQKALAAFPLRVEATDREARTYVASLRDHAAKLKVRYEAQLRKLHGDKVYEREWKSRIDETFARLEGGEPRVEPRPSLAKTSPTKTDDTLETVASALPDGTIGASVRGVMALKKGDARGAIEAAVSLIPVPGLKDAFGIASKVLFRG